MQLAVEDMRRLSLMLKPALILKLEEDLGGC